MKGVLILSVISIALFSFIGCRTVPQHLVREEVVIQYDEPIGCPWTDPVGGPHPLPVPDPPYLIGTNPPTSPPRDNQPNKPKDVGSYERRDPLQGGKNRGSGIIKSDPPVRKQEQNDRAQ